MLASRRPSLVTSSLVRTSLSSLSSLSSGSFVSSVSSPWFRRVVGLTLLLGACGDDPAPIGPDAPIAPVDGDVLPDAPMGTPSIEGTPVAMFETTSCSTGTVLELSKQIANEVNCLMPGQLVTFAENANIEFTGAAVLPYISTAAREDLYAAAGSNGTKVVRVTSAFRTVVQQYLLRRWFELGRCGITAAAEPGNSNHESGRALDVSNYNDWISKFGANGWSHSVPGDPVHFDHAASPDIRGADVLAFQRLWNRNAPDDQIPEDGSYGPMTEARVKIAPAEGFGIGATCAARLDEGLVIRLEPIDEPCAH